MAQYKIAGITDERTVCECCGKKDLKRTVVLEDNESGEFVFFGSTCAALALHGVKSVSEGRKVEKLADELVALKNRLERCRQNVADVTARIIAGQLRWIIGGVEKGALLTELLPSYQRELVMVEQKYSSLGEQQ